MTLSLFSTTSEYEELDGFIKFRKYLSAEQIDQILNYLRNALIKTPLFTPTLSNGKPMKISISSLGKVGWISDEKGYRYSGTHPNGNRWSEIPDFLYLMIEEYFKLARLNYSVWEYDSCLINFYKSNSSLGMHYDKDEKDLTFPITSISIGRPAKFDIDLEGKLQSFNLFNGDVIIMGGKSRNAKHGVNKLLTDISRLGNPLKDLDSRLNLTFRKGL